MILMEELYKTVATMDPITLVTELNEEMLSRSSKILSIARYASAMGFLISIAALAGFFHFTFIQFDFLISLGLIIIYIFSLRAAWYGYQQLHFLMDYQILASAISRGMRWDPLPQIPTGETILDRFLEYLKNQDDRFDLYYSRMPDNLVHDAEFEGKLKTMYKFDIYFEGGPKRFESYKESIEFFIRTVPEVNIMTIDTYRKELEDVLNNMKTIDSARFFLIQTDKSDFSDEIIEYVNTHYVNYWRGEDDSKTDWKSPIEILSEDPSGHYNIGSFYFG